MGLMILVVIVCLLMQLAEINDLGVRDPVVTMDIPLNPSSCMCRSMSAAASSFTIPVLLSSTISRSCSGDDTSCAAVNCDFTVSSSVYHRHVTIDPCTEVVNINAVDSTGDQVFQRDFSQSQSMPLDVGGGGFIHPVAYVVIQHFKYSMTVLVSFHPPLREWALG